MFVMISKPQPSLISPFKHSQICWARHELPIHHEDLASGHVHRQREGLVPAQDDRAKQVHPDRTQRKDLLLPTFNHQG